VVAEEKSKPEVKGKSLLTALFQGPKEVRRNDPTVAATVSPEKCVLAEMAVASPADLAEGSSAPVKSAPVKWI
tara:strand:+ start:157 stop:375 length:219 start_codon:yes stop_codon:yes gene_type:complete